MKRLILLAAGAVGASFCFIAPASAKTLEPVVHASGSPPIVAHRAVRTPTPAHYTVVAGDSLSGIGIRTYRTWQQLAGFNHIPNPDLIMVGQVLSVPPAGYVPVSVAAPSEPPPPAQHYSAQAVQATYIPTPAPVVSGSGIWACIAAHESGGNPATNTGNGYYGAFQDTLGSWQSAGGGPGLPSNYSYATQLAVNQRIQAQQGWGAWPVSSGACGV